MCFSSLLLSQNPVDSIVDENNGFNGYLVCPVGATQSDFYAQSFIANVDTIMRFGVIINQKSPEGQVILSIAADTSGKPNVTNPLYQGELIDPTTDTVWFYEEVIKIPVTLGQKYYVLIDGINNAGATGSAQIGLSDTYTDSYEYMIYSNNGGSSWTNYGGILAIYVEGTPGNYPVTFAVTDTSDDDTVAFEGVNISFENYGDKLTDELGLVAYDQVYFTGGDSIQWTATKLGYYTRSGYVKISDTTTINIILTRIPVYSVTFTVSDTNGSPIEGASVALDVYGDMITDAYGMVVYDTAYETFEPGIPYQISFAGYYPVNDSLVLTSDTVINIEMVHYPYYKIIFRVTDSSAYVEGVNVALAGYGNEITNADGLAVFDSEIYTAGESLTYEVTFADYYPVSDSLVLTSDTVINIEMVHYPYYKIIFRVTDGSAYAEGVNVALAGYGNETTNADGLAVFDSVIYTAGESLTYEVTGTGINTATGNIVIDTAKTINVVVSYHVGISGISKENIKVYPNPFTGYIELSLGHIIADFTFVLYNSAGQVVLNEVLSNQTPESLIRINTEGLEKGIYFYQLITKQESWSDTIIKN